MYNGVVVLNKPKGKTSHDMIYFMRRTAMQKRVGHTGTLDPNATGVLPICLGNATKASDYIANGRKKYLAHIHFGIVTDTEDLCGNILEKKEVASFSEDEFLSVLNSFIGNIKQIPPMYSAVKINGKKLYELARKGETVNRNAREICIYSIDLKEFDTQNKSAVIEVCCSKGTYIRTLCSDIGKALGCGACMGDLKRIQSGVFDIDDSYTAEMIERAAENNELEKLIIPTDKLFEEFRAVFVEKKDEFKVRNGMPLSGFDGYEGEKVRIYGQNNNFLCISQMQNGILKMLTSFWSVN